MSLYTTNASLQGPGHPIDGRARLSVTGNPGLLGADSSDVVEAGMGVVVRAEAIGNYEPLFKLPDSADFEFKGIVPESAIPSPEVAALLGVTSGRVPPGTHTGLGNAGMWRVPLAAGTTTANAPAFLVFSGANAGKWAISDLGTQPDYELALTSAGANAIGFSATIGGVTGPNLTFTSVDKATDAAALVNAWNSDAFYLSKGIAEVIAGNDIAINGVSYEAIAFTDTSTGANAVADSVTQALVAPTAARIEGAFYRVASATASIVEIK